jgi:hypothetical protein
LQDLQRDLFRGELHQRIVRRHPLLQLADQIHWEEFHAAFAAGSDTPGVPPHNSSMVAVSSCTPHHLQ